MNPQSVGLNIVTISYRSTSYYVLESCEGERLIVDCGWPGTLGIMAHELRRKGLEPSAIGYVLVTHFHPDHAGLVEEIKREGASLILVDLQAPHVSRLEGYVKPGDGFIPIRTEDAIVLSAPDSRVFFRQIGFEGEIVPTPGHSDDSVALVLDSGIAFTGDLQPEEQSAPGDRLTRSSWARLRALGVSLVYPAHGGPRALQ